jgi:hypothetical protein
MIMPRSVSAERSLCAQIAASASFSVSISFTVRLLRPAASLVLARARRKRFTTADEG